MTLPLILVAGCYILLFNDFSFFKDTEIMAVKITAGVRDALLYTVGQDFGYGSLHVYTGTQPASAGGTHSDTTLASWTLAGFNTASGGSMALNVGALTQPVTAPATGTAGWARATDNSTKQLDMVVTATGGGGDLEINDVNIVTSDSVNITSLTILMPET